MFVILIYFLIYLHENVYIFIGHHYLLREHHNSQTMQFTTPLVHLGSFALHLQ